MSTTIECISGGKTQYELPVNEGIVAVTVSGSPVAYTNPSNTLVVLDAVPAADAIVRITYKNEVFTFLDAQGQFLNPDGSIGWDDYTGDITVRGSGGADPTWLQFRDGINAYAFSATAMKQAWCTYHITHTYAMGTPIYLHTHWSNAGTSTGVVRWGFEFTVAKGHGQQVFGATQTVYVEEAAAAQYTHQITEVALADVVPATNLEPDSLILLRVFRDATHPNDTCTDPVFLFLADCHYQKGQFATRQKSPDFFS